MVVVLSGDGARGLVKAATWFAKAADGNVKFLGAASANYVPLFPQASHSAWNYIANRADAGTIGTSGGFAVTGLAAQLESGLVARGFGDEDMSNLARPIRELSGLG